MRLLLLILASSSFLTTIVNAQSVPLELKPNRVTLANGSSFELYLPENLAISIAAEGLKRVRFMARSPDGRIFVTDMSIAIKVVPKFFAMCGSMPGVRK